MSLASNAEEGGRYVPFLLSGYCRERLSERIGCSMENESLDTSKEETKEVQQPAAPEESGKQEDWKSPVKSLVNDLLDIAESVIVSVFVVV